MEAALKREPFLVYIYGEVLMKKKLVLAYCCGYLTASALGMWALSEENKRSRKFLKSAQLHHRIVKRFVDLVPYETSQQIADEFEFDFIVSGIDI